MLKEYALKGILNLLRIFRESLNNKEYMAIMYRDFYKLLRLPEEKNEVIIKGEKWINDFLLLLKFEFNGVQYYLVDIDMGDDQGYVIVLRDAEGEIEKIEEKVINYVKSRLERKRKIGKIKGYENKENQYTFYADRIENEENDYLIYKTDWGKKYIDLKMNKGIVSISAKDINYFILMQIKDEYKLKMDSIGFKIPGDFLTYMVSLYII